MWYIMTRVISRNRTFNWSNTWVIFIAYWRILLEFFLLCFTAVILKMEDNNVLGFGYYFWTHFLLYMKRIIQEISAHSFNCDKSPQINKNIIYCTQLSTRKKKNFNDLKECLGDLHVSWFVHQHNIMTCIKCHVEKLD